MASIFHEMLKARVTAAIASAGSLAKVNHSGLKGTLREIVVRELLAPLLPQSAGLAQGEIIDPSGGTSCQQDIVIFDQQLVPALLIDRSNGIIPIESALYTIEVKSKTSSGEIKTSVSNAKSVVSLVGHGESPATEKTIPCIFAFDSDLEENGKSELERYQELDTRTKPIVRSICVVGRGYWYYDTKWNKYEPSDDYGEVIQFMAGILNTYFRVQGSRNTTAISQYL